MTSSANFTISKGKLLATLNQFLKVAGKRSSKQTTVEITIIDDYIILVIPGVNLKLASITSSSAKFTVGLLYFIDFLKNHPEDITQFIVTENLIKCGTISFSAPTIQFETDEVLRSIDLPANYVNMHMAKLALSGRYTASEIAFNNLEGQKEEAIAILKQDIDKIAYIAQAYNISRKDIENFLVFKIKESYEQG